MNRIIALCFTAVMLAVCVYVVGQGLAVDRLDYEIREMRTDLSTNRQRERKQQVEYDQAAALLPENEARLAQVKPEAEAAKASETNLRAQRKTLRAEVAELKTAAEAAEAEAETAAQQLAESGAAYELIRTQAETLLRPAEGEVQP